jgi:hypothetical protein
LRERRMEDHSWAACGSWSWARTRWSTRPISGQWFACHALVPKLLFCKWRAESPWDQGELSNLALRKWRRENRDVSCWSP